MLRKFPLKISKLLSLLLTLSCVSGATYAAEVPRLLLCFYVEGMQLDLVNSYSPAFVSQGKGIERLFKQGVLYPKVEWNIVAPNASSALATLASGSFPSSHGVGLGTDLLSLLQDSNSRGVYTADRLSASNLQYQTFSDVLRVITEGKSIVYSVASIAENAITVGGRRTSAAFWIDDRSGQWCSSSYYPDASSILYAWKKERSSILQPSHLADKEVIWTPMGNYKTVLLPYYGGKPAQRFRHTLKGYQKSILFKRSALANDAVATLSEALIERIQKESKEQPAVLHIVLNCNVSGEDTDFSPYSPETIDAYSRIDKAIATIVDKAEKTLGASNVATSLVALPLQKGPFATSVGKYTASPSEKNLYDRIRSLVNLYLSALYGKGNWVTKVEEPYLYLDQSFIESKAYSLFEIRQRVATLMEEMSEVKRAYPLGHSTLYVPDRSREQLLHSLPASSNADLFFISQKSPANSTLHSRVKESLTNFLQPSYSFMVLRHPKLVGKVVCRPVDIASWGATWAYLFHIRPPSESGGLPLDEVFYTSSY